MALPLVLSGLALFAALGGDAAATSAYTSAKKVIGGSQIRKSAIAERHLSRTVRRKLAKAGQPGAAGPEGSAGAAGPAGPAGPGGPAISNPFTTGAGYMTNAGTAANPGDPPATFTSIVAHRVRIVDDANVAIDQGVKLVVF